MSYSYQNGCNRLTGWTATSTNNFADLLLSDVSGQSSELIGTNSALGQLYVSNSVATDVPSVVGSNFSASAFSLAAGTNSLIAVIGDQAGNVGYATNIVVMQITTNASYQYNDAGCVTNIGYSGVGFSENIGLTWNSQYQLSTVSTNGVAAERNGFDALGRRVWSWDRTVTNYFVYDGIQVIADVNATGGLIRSYVWGPGIDNLLAMTVYTGSSTNTYYALTDHLGTVHALTDSSGAIVESYKFDAWGRVLGVYDANNNPLTQSAIGNRYLWQGREYSWKSGFYYFRARWYDPITGRWLSNDPIGISGGLNQYVFCGDNPVNYTDPLGLCTEGGGVDGWYGWWDNMHDYWRSEVDQASDTLSTGLPWPVAGVLNTGMEVGMTTIDIPFNIGHLGEGSGTFAGQPSWENAPGLIHDIGTAGAVVTGGAVPEKHWGQPLS